MSQTGIPLRRSARLLTTSLETSVSFPALDPTLKRKRPVNVVVINSDEGSSKLAEESVTNRPVKKRKNKATKKLETGDSVSEGTLTQQKRQRKLKPEPVYIIPDVEKKETTFRGRLGAGILLCVSDRADLSLPGYACLNTVLRNKKPASEAIFCSRTCRYVVVTLIPLMHANPLVRIESSKKHGMEWVKSLGQKNVEDLLKVIQWNEDNVSH